MAGDGRGAGLLLVGALAVVGVVVATSRSPVPPEPPGPSASLTVDAARLTVTQGGVVVVPLALRSTGPALEVVRADVYAEPVREDPLVQAPEVLDAGAGRRFVALVTPDCRLLSPRTGLVFTASVLLRVRAGGRSADLVVDLHADDAVRERVARLCGSR